MLLCPFRIADLGMRKEGFENVLPTYAAFVSGYACRKANTASALLRPSVQVLSCAYLEDETVRSTCSEVCERLDEEHYTSLQCKSHDTCLPSASGPNFVRLRLEVISAFKRHRCSHALPSTERAHSASGREVHMEAAKGKAYLQAGSVREARETSAYFVEPQQALKAATASGRAIPLMRSIVRRDMYLRLPLPRRGGLTNSVHEPSESSLR